MKEFLMAHFDSLAVFTLTYAWVVTAYIQFVRI